MIRATRGHVTQQAAVCVQVEVGGKADRLEQPLLVGDEIIIINEVELSGYRQEAIALVKGSYKTLQLTIRRYSHLLCNTQGNCAVRH